VRLYATRGQGRKAMSSPRTSHLTVTVTGESLAVAPPEVSRGSWPGRPQGTPGSLQDPFWPSKGRTPELDAGPGGPGWPLGFHSTWSLSSGDAPTRREPLPRPPGVVATSAAPAYWRIRHRVGAASGTATSRLPWAVGPAVGYDSEWPRVHWRQGLVGSRPLLSALPRFHG
jgi:hypothetical protein